MEKIVLTPKQQRFCDEYLIDLNASQAALRAGYSGPTALNGYLMTIPKIRYYLQERTEQVSRKAQVNHEMVLAELMKTAFSNMRNYYRDDGSIKGMHELTDDEAAALWCMKISEGKDGRSSFIRLNNKLSALEKIAKHLSFYDAELLPPEKEYVYIDKDTVDKYDTFDDEMFYEHENDDDAEYFDEDDEEYYPWDTECKIAIAKAKEACRLRRAGSSKQEAGSEKGSRESLVGSPEPGGERPELEDEDDGDELADEYEEDDELIGKYADPEPPKRVPLPAPEYLTDEAVAMLLRPNCPPLDEGWLTVKKLPEGVDQSGYNKAWREKIRLTGAGVDVPADEKVAPVYDVKQQQAMGLFGKAAVRKKRSERYYR